MFLYQHQNSFGTDFFESILYENFSFIPHLHRHYEAAWLIEGELGLTVDGREQLMRPGDAALILPNQIHAYRSDARTRVWISVFSGDQIHDANAALSGHVPAGNVFHPSDALRAYALERLIHEKTPCPGVRARLAALCAECLELLPLLPRPEHEADSPAHRLMQYASLHFREDVTLRDAAALLGYDPGYLSRCFHRLTGVNFRRFLNACRIDYARRLIRAGNISMTEAALESGFQSIRTFNRAFLEQTGAPPHSNAGGSRIP